MRPPLFSGFIYSLWQLYIHKGHLRCKCYIHIQCDMLNHPLGCTRSLPRMAPSSLIPLWWAPEVFLECSRRLILGALLSAVLPWSDGSSMRLRVCGDQRVGALIQQQEGRYTHILWLTNRDLQRSPWKLGERDDRTMTNPEDPEVSNEVPTFQRSQKTFNGGNWSAIKGQFLKGHQSYRSHWGPLSCKWGSLKSFPGFDLRVC